MNRQIEHVGSLQRIYPPGEMVEVCHTLPSSSCNNIPTRRLSIHRHLQSLIVGNFCFLSGLYIFVSMYVKPKALTIP